jgi:NAD(P)-dependent dehydrogenase (short-subunit alcohol dehydrogenase family)
VICADRLLASAEETAALIRAEGGKAVPAVTDATDEASMNELVARTLRDTGRLDVMHNNVGGGAALGGPDMIAPDRFQRDVALNLMSAYLGVRVAVPVMQRLGGGVILNTSSLLAVRFLARPVAAYSAAKAGVEALTRSCAAAYGRDNIRVNCLRIGFSETPLATRHLDRKAVSGEERERMLDTTRRKIPLRREHGDAFDVARAAAFLASDDARHLSGVILNIDGAAECGPL